jgi:hypothetical protein
LGRVLKKNKKTFTIEEYNKLKEETESNITTMKKEITVINRKLKNHKEEMYELFEKNKDNIRTLNSDAIHTKNIISSFESSLTRTLGMTTNSLTTDLFTVKTYYYQVLQSLILNGFMFEGNKYVVFTASAGQIRTKKTMFIKESVLRKYERTLMCGLTLDEINKKGGANVNKYLAYLALSNSATDVCELFDIRKTIVVNDFSREVNGLVDYIDHNTYDITRKEMNINIEHTDGCGMILPQYSKKSFMIRSPWLKGLLVPFAFDEFVKEHNMKEHNMKDSSIDSVNYGIVEDIYGVKHDILKEEIQVIFTKSQFKMWKYYNSWNEYVENFVKYDCEVGYCNEEEHDFEDAKLNYQFLQSLTNITDKQLETISKRTLDKIRELSVNVKTIQEIFGAVEKNRNKSHFQEALMIYPELMLDAYAKHIIGKMKKKVCDEAKSGKLFIDGTYTFISPDLYAFCERLFLKQESPVGLLENGEVFCKLYENVDKLDCLRSPHLYREHAIRNNVVSDDMGEYRKKWFITNDLYVSSKDLISKLVMCDK